MNFSRWSRLVVRGKHFRQAISPDKALYEKSLGHAQPLLRVTLACTIFCVEPTSGRTNRIGRKETSATLLEETDLHTSNKVASSFDNDDGRSV